MGVKGAFVDWVMLWKKALPATKASYGPMQSNEGGGGIWQAAQRSRGCILNSAFYWSTPWRASASASHLLPSAQQTEFIASAAH